jgi:predicted nucleic acid-binding protein
MRGRALAVSRVFVDTNAFGALALDGDAYHARALAATRQLATDRARLLTTNFVVAETHALVLACAGIDPALRMLRRIEQTVEAIVRVTEEDEQRARAIVEHYRDKDFTLTDATSFAVMERLAMRQAFTFDRHFVQFGFELVDPV